MRKLNEAIKKFNSMYNNLDVKNKNAEAEVILKYGANLVKTYGELDELIEIKGRLLALQILIPMYKKKI